MSVQGCDLSDLGRYREHTGPLGMDIMLHLGAHRSASTTFQSFLWTNRVRLSRQGLTCWTPKRTRDGLMRGLMRHPALMTLEDERRGFRSVGRIRVEIGRLARAGQRGLLISEENMLGTMSNNMADFRLYPLLKERLLRFAPAFDGHEIRIGLCIRSYEDYWTSCLANLMARGRTAPTVDELDFLTTQPRRWRFLVRDIAAAFPQAEMFVCPFERIAGQPSELLGHFWPEDAKNLEHQEAWRNRSPKLTILNEIMAMRGEAALDERPVDADARWMPFDEDQRDVLRAEYRRDLAWLKAGAEGLAHYIDAPARLPAMNMADHIQTTIRGDGRITPAPSPDRGEHPRFAHAAHSHLGGHDYGVKKGLGRAGST